MKFVMRTALATLTLAAGAALAGEIEIRMTVSEPVGLKRRAEPASGGLPFKPGEVKDVSELALFDKNGKLVAAQFSRLAGYGDGSVQWALADFLADVPAKGETEFVVKRGKAAAPGRALDIAETDELVTVDTGAARFAISKTKFSLLESVKLAGKQIAGPGLLEVVDVDGKVFKAGRPTKVSWEYRGPVRATLRVDGPYLDEGGKLFTSHTTRLTFWAGLSAVKVEHSLRNSVPENGFDAKIKQATISLGLGFQGKEEGKGKDWAACGDGRAGLLVVERHTGGCFPGAGTYWNCKAKSVHKLEAGGGRAAVWVIPEGGEKIGYGADHFALADLAHKDSEIWLDFYTGSREAKVNEDRQKALRSKLHALTDGSWISETEALGIGSFGTLADEIETYKKWGWKRWDDPIFKKRSKVPHEPDAYVAKEMIHDESEGDSAEGCLLMYVRTGKRGYFDWGEAWARYYKAHYAYRTDGFEYKEGRPTKGLKVGWYAPKEYSWKDSRAEISHFYGAGLFDYYCLTGDVDALEGGRDLAEHARALLARLKPGKPVAGNGPRNFARPWMVVLRLAQLTRDPQDLAGAERAAQLAFKSPDWDERGFFHGGGTAHRKMYKHYLAQNAVPPRLAAHMKEKGLTITPITCVVKARDGSSWPVRMGGGWQQNLLNMAFERHYRLSGNPASKARVIKMAEFSRDYQWNKKCEHVHYKVFLDFPEKGMAYDGHGEWDEGCKNCPGPGAKHSGGYTRDLPDVFARAYGLTGDKSWLEWAKKAWDRGSKRGFKSTGQSAASDEVYTYAFCYPPRNDCSLTTGR
ncbi:MAG: exo-rhamnogalacturonan lyase family protein, partial [Planctomycetota bacterium]